MEKNQLVELLEKYEAGTCTEEERKAVEEWYARYDGISEEWEAGTSPDDLLQGTDNPKYARMFEAVKAELNIDEDRTYRIPPARINFRRWGSVAVALAITFMAFYFWYTRSEKSDRGQRASVAVAPIIKDLDPGGNRAMLKLTDGAVIYLDDVHKGKLAEQGGATVIKLEDGQLSYSPQHTGSSSTVFNTISTPRGGQYQVTLPDETKVWLNAASSLRFPTAFHSGERVVELTGEGYFEVSQLRSSSTEGGIGAKIPFLVRILSPDGQQKGVVHVLGTHFNVMAYGEEQLITTTLLEGSVKVSGNGVEKTIRPGQQAVFSPGATTVRVTNADVEESVAWKNNLFWFDNADIYTIMRNISRWYDVEVTYEGKVSKRFTGTLPRNMAASRVFSVLEQTGGVHFRIEGKKVVVAP